MSEKMAYPPDDYCDAFLKMFEQLNGPESMEPMVKHAGRAHDARIWCSRGDVLEKAGLTLVHVRRNDSDGKRIVRQLNTVIHPHNPRAPGLVTVIGQERAASLGKSRIYCLIDMWRTTRRPDAKIIHRFRRAIQARCQDHDRSYSELNKALSAIRLFGGNGCNAGISFGEFERQDIPFLDHLVRCLVDEIPRLIEMCGARHPDVQDFQERNEIRREFLVWTFAQGEGDQRAIAPGVPWAVFEAFAFPPEVYY